MLKNMKQCNCAGATPRSAIYHYPSATRKHQTDLCLNRKTLNTKSFQGYHQYLDTNDKYFSDNSTLKHVAGVWHGLVRDHGSFRACDQMALKAEQLM